MQRLVAIENGIFKITYKLTEKEEEIISYVKENGFLDFSKGTKDKDSDKTGKYILEDLNDLIKYGFLEIPDSVKNLYVVLGRAGHFYKSEAVSI